MQSKQEFYGVLYPLSMENIPSPTDSSIDFQLTLLSFLKKIYKTKSIELALASALAKK